MENTLYSSGDINKMIRVSPAMLVYYEKRDLVQPAQVVGGRKLYDDTMVKRLKKIVELKEHYTLKGLKQMIDRGEI
jgi:DNA-binding transcriptional MerR regulator